MKKLLITLFFLYSFINLAHSGTIDIFVSQVGDDTVFNGSGSIDLTGLGASSPSSLSVSRSQFNLFGGTSGTIDIFDITIPTFVPLNNNFFSFDSVTGDSFFAQGLNGGNNDQGFFGITEDYTSNDTLSFQWVVNNQSLSDLNLNFGTVAAFGANTVNLSEVPIPAALPLFIGCLASFGFLARRRKLAS